MKLRHTLHALAVCISLLSATPGHGRGGETGTLDELPEWVVASNFKEVNRGPSKNWSPYYLPQEHFRRLRARLSVQPMAPIPGWDAHQAFRLQDRYFSEDGYFEILPLLRDSIRY
jgi:hypothetical protein